MAFSTFWIKADSIPRIELHPTFDASERFVVNNQVQQTISGGYTLYKLVGGHYAISLPLTFVTSEHVSYIRDLWVNHAPIYYTVNLSDNPETILCKISNINEPFVFNSKGQYDKFSGTLNLKSIQSWVDSSSAPALTNEDIGQKAGTGVFILDDPTWGKLDHTYNKLME